MYSTVDPEVEDLSCQFCEEAEGLLELQSQQEEDTMIHLAALQFLSLGYLGQGRDHAVLKYLNQAISTGERLGLWGVDDDRAKTRMNKMGSAEANNYQVITWGVFNWIW
jgi:hypothetical protein